MERLFEDLIAIARQRLSKSQRAMMAARIMKPMDAQARARRESR